MSEKYKKFIQDWNEELYDRLESIIDLMPDTNIFESSEAISSITTSWDPWKVLYIDLEHIGIDEVWHREYLEYAQDHNDSNNDKYAPENILSIKNTVVDNIEKSCYTTHEIFHDHLEKCSKHIWNSKFDIQRIKLFFDIYPALSWCLMALFNNAKIDAINIGKIDDVIALDLSNNDIAHIAVRIYDENNLIELLKHYNGPPNVQFLKLVVSSPNIILLSLLYNRNWKIFINKSVLENCNYYNALYMVENIDLTKITPKQEADIIIIFAKLGYIYRLFGFSQLGNLKMHKYVNYFIKFNQYRIIQEFYTGEISEIDGKHISQLQYGITSGCFNESNILYYLDNHSIYDKILYDIPLNIEIVFKIATIATISLNGWADLIERLIKANIDLKLYDKCPREFFKVVTHYLDNNLENIYVVINRCLFNIGVLWQKYEHVINWDNIMMKLTKNKRHEFLDDRTYAYFPISLRQYISSNSDINSNIRSTADDNLCHSNSLIKILEEIVLMVAKK